MKPKAAAAKPREFHRARDLLPYLLFRVHSGCPNRPGCIYAHGEWFAHSPTYNFGEKQGNAKADPYLMLFRACNTVTHVR
jgi:hypothetical protein